MMTAKDPACMAPTERLAEIASILAKGYQRYCLSRQKELEEPAQAEAPCDRTINTQRTLRKQEVA